jgi:hypothetical protein
VEELQYLYECERGGGGGTPVFVGVCLEGGEVWRKGGGGVRIMGPHLLPYL